MKSGDYVIKLNGTEVTGKDDFITRIENCGGEQQILTIRRDAETYDVRINRRGIGRESIRSVSGSGIMRRESVP